MADNRKVVDLAEHRIRLEREFEDDSVAYIEALWGCADDPPIVPWYYETRREHSP